MPNLKHGEDSNVAIGIIAAAFLVLFGLYLHYPKGYPKVISDERGIRVAWCVETGIPKHEAVFVTRCTH